jgi:hypothetical protein
MVCITERVRLSIVAVQKDDIRLGALEPQVPLNLQPHLLRPKTCSCNDLAPAIGEMRCGAVLLATLGGLDVERSAPAVLSVLIGVNVYVSADVTFASLAFWAANNLLRPASLCWRQLSCCANRRRKCRLR